MNKVLSALFLTPDRKSFPTQSIPRLLKWALQFSPVAALDVPPVDDAEDTRYWGMNVDLTGSERLFKGDENALNRFEHGLVSLGFKARVAIAPTLGCAWAVSRYDSERLKVIEKAEMQEVLSRLPLAALRLSKKNEEGLRELNITKVGHLFRLSRKSLLERFDKELLKRIGQAVGAEEEIISSVPLPTVYRAERVFAGAVTQLEALTWTAEELLDELLKKLGSGVMKAGNLITAVKRCDAPPLYKNISLSVPSLERKHLWRLLRAHVETINMGFGVEALALYITRTEYTVPSQSTYEEADLKDTGDSRTDKALGELLDTLSQQLGANSVFKLSCLESHIPEKSFQYTPLNGLPKKTRTFAALALVETERPSMLFYKPLPIRAVSVLPDSPPFWIKWRGAVQEISTAQGPERIAPEWWGKDNSLFATRDYFKVQLTSGLWLWVFRELRESKWFVHGVWA